MNCMTYVHLVVYLAVRRSLTQLQSLLLSNQYNIHSTQNSMIGVTALIIIEITRMEPTSEYHWKLQSLNRALKNYPRNGIVSDRLALANNVTTAVLKKVDRKILMDVLAYTCEWESQPTHQIRITVILVSTILITTIKIEIPVSMPRRRIEPKVVNVSQIGSWLTPYFYSGSIPLFS